MMEATVFSGILILPILVIALFLVTKREAYLHSIHLAGIFLLCGAYGFLAFRYFVGGLLPMTFPMQFYLDGLSFFMMGILLFVALFVSVYAVSYMKEELRRGHFSEKRLRVFYVLFHVFLTTMLLSLSTGNMGFMWVAIEGTTLASAFLVGFYGDRGGIEAAWKYVIICSVGIGIALLGIIFLHIASVGVVKGTGLELYWPYLKEKAALLDIPALRLSFLFVLVGLGTKAGLAPMHTWLPDAHSQAPAPISAMLSGVLLNTSMYGILRELSIVNKAMGSNAFTGKLLIAVGLLSILISAVFVFRQKDYKRLLAYSSIEHMGILALGAGIFTPAALVASLLHMMNHSITKSMLFLASGNVFLQYGSREIVKIRGLLRRIPVTGIVFLLGIFAITGMPPFGLFVSKLRMLIAIFQNGNTAVGALFVFLLAAVFIGFAVSLLKMFTGEPGGQKAEHRGRGMEAGLLILLILIIGTGFYMPQPLIRLIEVAQAAIGGN